MTRTTNKITRSLAPALVMAALIAPTAGAYQDISSQDMRDVAEPSADRPEPKLTGLLSTDPIIGEAAGKTVVLTGANSGVGLATARALAGAGAEVVLAVRDERKGAEAAATIAGGPRPAPVDGLRAAHRDAVFSPARRHP